MEQPTGIIAEQLVEQDAIAIWPVLRADPGGYRSDRKLPTRLVGIPAAGFMMTPWEKEVPVLNRDAYLELGEDPVLPGQEFTFEAWVAFRKLPSGPRTLAELSGQHGISWTLGLNRHLGLEFFWADDNGEKKCVSSIQMVDLLRPGNWLHIAVAFRNHCHTSQPYIRDYSRVHIYCTPFGEKFPRLVAAFRAFEKPQISEEPACLLIGSDRRGECGWEGAVTNAVLTGRAKLANEFPALGQSPPENINFSCGFTAGSVFYPVKRAERDFVVGCKPYLGSGNYWFYAEVTGDQNLIGEEVKVEVLPVPGGSSMLLSMFVSYDKKHWQRIQNGYYIDDRDSHFAGAYSFFHCFKQFPAWLCTYIPYTIDDTDQLQKDVELISGIEVITLARSVEGRPIRLFKVTDRMVPDKDKHVVYMQAGQHSPAEQASGRVLDIAIRQLTWQAGLIFNHVLSPGEVAELLRTTIFLFVPIVNVDGCYHGGSGANMNGINTNRDWIKGTQPEVAGVLSFLNNWLGEGRQLGIALDFHAGGCWKNHTVLAQDRAKVDEPLPADWFSEQERFLCTLDKYSEISQCDARYGGFTRGTFAHLVSTSHGIPGLTVELSHLTYEDLSGAIRPVDQEHLERLGPQMVKTCAEWLKKKN